MQEYQRDFSITNGASVCVVEEIKNTKQFFSFGKVGQQELVEYLYRTKDNRRVLEVSDGVFEIEGSVGTWVKVN